ncbi:MAG TPA: TonB family protein [Thermoanaerobaculia bacterium]|nr:TonB family protein [Thermoanaerobaculia bacterium]
MFETSVVRARALQSGRYRVFTISLLAHSAVILGAIAVSVASTSFPEIAPDEVANAPIFMPVQIPPPLGNPNGGAPPRQPEQPRQTTPPPQPPNQVTAPSTVPDDVPQLDAPSSGDSNTTGPSEGTVPGPIGIPWGDPNSPGSLDAPPVVSAAPVPEKIYTVGEVKAPVMIHRVEPVYPSAFVRAKMPGKVAMRCVIDKNGRVRDPQVLFATNQAFADSVLRALQQWRYTPASLHGQAVDCYLDLKVDFGVGRLVRPHGQADETSALH